MFGTSMHKTRPKQARLPGFFYASDQLLFADDAIFDIGDEDQNENSWAWPDAFGLGCCLAPEPTTPATPGVRFVSKGKRQRVPDESDSGR